MMLNDDTNTSDDSDIKSLMPKGDMLSGNSHPIISPYGVFRASDGDLNIGAAT